MLFWGVKIWPESTCIVQSLQFQLRGLISIKNLGLIFLIGVYVLHPMHGQY